MISVRMVPKQRPHSRSRTMERKRCVTQDNYWGDRRTRMRPRLSARDEPRWKVCSTSWCRELPPKQLSDSQLAPRADNTGLDSHRAAKRENTCWCSQAFLLAFLGPWRGQRRWGPGWPTSRANKTHPHSRLYSLVPSRELLFYLLK